MQKYIAPKVFSVLQKIELPATKEETKQIRLNSKEEELLDWYLEKYLKIKRNPIKTKYHYVWRPAPCECTDSVICSYCVHANMVLWEKEEREAGRPVKKPITKKRRKRK